MNTDLQNIPEHWDLVIKPKKNLFDLGLNDLWKYRDLIMLFVRRDFVSKYKQSILGPLWFIIQPLITTLMYTLVFGQIANISTDGLPQILFYMSGVVCWTYFATSFTTISDTFIANAGIFGKVYFPRLTYPISIVISNLIQFGIQFLILIAFMLFYYSKGTQIGINMYIFLIPVLLILMAGIGLGFGIIISALTTKYRDLRFLITFGVQLWMFITPVIYPVSVLPQNLKFLIYANPLTPLVEAFRFALLGTGSFNFNSLLYCIAFTIVVLLVGVLLFNRVERSFMDTV